MVTGADGFIGGHLVNALRRTHPGAIRAVDIKPPDVRYQRFDDVDDRQLDLRLRLHCSEVADGVGTIYQLDDGLEGIQRLMASDVDVPINPGLEETVTVDGVVDVAEAIAGIPRSESGRHQPQRRSGLPGLGQAGVKWDIASSAPLALAIRSTPLSHEGSLHVTAFAPEPEGRPPPEQSGSGGARKALETPAARR